MSTRSNVAVGIILGTVVGVSIAYWTQPKPVFHITRPDKPRHDPDVSIIEQPVPPIVRHTIVTEADPYDERTIAHPYNPGPKFIFAPIPDKIVNHRNLHLPDPVCLAGCSRKEATHD